jgi:hypothetical protein
MALYDIDTDSQAEDLLPPTKRGTNTIAWLRGVLIGTISYYFTNWQTYTVRLSPSPYSSGTYNKYAQVVWNQYIYECLINGTVTDPSDTTSWKALNIQFVNTDERQYYTGDLNSLQWSLNKWYGTTYRDLPDIPDIYIEKIVPSDSTFIVGITEDESSAVLTGDSTGYIGLDLPSGDYVNFSVNVPVAFWPTLGADDATREYNIRSFVNQHVDAGCLYKVNTY